MIKKSKFLRFLTFWGILFPSFFGMAYFLGYFPEEPESLSESNIEEIAPPVRISAGKVDLDFKILNPQSAEINVLDEALSLGVVHYPGSASLGEDGNVFLFGHSSFLPVVHNQAYKAFNGIKDFEEGDIIKLSSDSTQYHYRVTKIILTTADDALVDLRKEPNVRKLTLSTCNSFGAKDERYVVEAEFVESYQLEQLES